jgi:hypothetical protein
LQCNKNRKESVALASNAWHASVWSTNMYLEAKLYNHEALVPVSAEPAKNMYCH